MNNSVKNILLALLCLISTQTISQTNTNTILKDSLQYYEGFIHNTEGKGIKGIEFYNNLDELIFTTLKDGKYFFILPISQSDLRVIHGSPNDYQINTYDILLLQRHILKFKEFKYPHEYIAADLNNDGLINGADIISLRNIILNKTPSLTNYSNWKYYTLRDLYQHPKNVLDSLIPSGNLASEITPNRYVDITISKTGDLNLPDKVYYAKEGEVYIPDDINPTVSLLNLSTALIQTWCQVTLWAVDFDKQSTDNLTPVEELRYTFTTTSPKLDPLYSDSDKSSYKTFTSTDITNSPIALDIYVWDRNNNYAKGTVQLTFILPNDSHCP